MTYPKISILIPVYNRQDFIAECIQSALNQTYKNTEIIVVDNASTDATWAICQKLASVDVRIKIFRNELNIGPVKNWEKCVSEASGELVKILFSDDCMLPDFLMDTYTYLSDENIGFVTTATYIGSSISNSSLSYAGKENIDFINRDEYYNRLVHSHPPVPYSPCAALFRLCDVRQNLLLNIPIKIDHNFNANGAGPDVLIYALTAKKYKSFVMLNKPLMFFRAHPGSFTESNVDNRVTEGYRLALAYFYKTHSSQQHWISWVSAIWINNLRTRSTTRNPFAVAKRYSGDGTMLEVLMMLKAVVNNVIIKIKKILMK